MAVTLARAFRSAPRPSLPLLLLIGTLVGVTVWIANTVGLVDIRIYMGLVALYVAMGVFGGTLRADLAVIMLYVTGITAFVAVPLLAATVSEVAGAALLVIAVGACGLIPALGRRFGSVRLGIGLIAVYAFGYETASGASASHVISGSFIALGIVVVLRLLSAIPDPDGPLRRAIAAVLVDASRPTLESAATSWLRGPARLWASEVLVGAVQFRGACWAMVQRQNEVGDGRRHSLELFMHDAAAAAGLLAAEVRARRPNGESLVAARTALEGLEVHRLSLHVDDQDIAKVALDGLKRLAASVTKRDRRVVRGAASIRRAATRGSLRAALSFDSDYLRSAARSMVIVAIALTIVSVADQPAFALPLLMGAYGVLQTTWEASVVEARRRSVGVIVGAAAALLIVSTASPTAAGVLSVAALILSFAYISSSIAIFMGGLVVTLTVAIAPQVGVEPSRYAVGYALAVIAGAALAAGVGFLTVPRPTIRVRRRVLARALVATADALGAMGKVSTSEERHRMHAAFRAQQNTMFATTGRSADWDAEASVALGGLNMIGVALVLNVVERSSEVDRTLAAVVEGLRGDGRQPLSAHVAINEVPRGDALAQLLRVEYARLHAAMVVGSRESG